MGRYIVITTKDSWFQHLAIEVPGKDGRTEWHEPVDDAQYRTLK